VADQQLALTIFDRNSSRHPIVISWGSSASWLDVSIPKSRAPGNYWVVFPREPIFPPAAYLSARIFC